MQLKEFFVLMLVCLIWGLHFIVMKVTVGQTAEPLFYAASRMSFVLICLLPFLKWHHGQMLKILLGGLGYGALNYAFMFSAIELTTATAAAITIELYVPFAIILSMIFLKEDVGLWRGLGILLALIGVTVIALAKPDEAAGPYFLLGIILMAGAALSEAIGAVSVKSVSQVKPLELLAWFAVVGTVVLWPLTLILEDNQLAAFSSENRLPFGLALAYTIILVSLIAHASYYWLLQRLPIHTVSTSGLMTTVIAMAASVLILKEPMTVEILIGGLLTFCGIGIILWRNRQRNKKPPVDHAH